MWLGICTITHENTLGTYGLKFCPCVDSGFNEYVKQLKTLKCFTIGFLPLHNSFDVTFCIALWGNFAWRWIVVFTAFAQYFNDTCSWWNMHQVASITIWLNLFATSFYWRVYRVGKLMLDPMIYKKRFESFWCELTTIINLKTFILFPFWLSTIALNSWNFVKHSPLFFKK